MKKHIPHLPSICILFCFFLLTEKVAAHVNQNTGSTSTYVKGITTGRAEALTIVVLGLISFVLALRAKKRFEKNSNNRNGIAVAFILSMLTITLSALHLIMSAGAVFGSGSGKAGAIVALLFGVISTTLSGVTLRKK